MLFRESPECEILLEVGNIGKNIVGILLRNLNLGALQEHLSVIFHVFTTKTFSGIQKMLGVFHYGNLFSNPGSIFRDLSHLSNTGTLSESLLRKFRCIATAGTFSVIQELTIL